MKKLLTTVAIFLLAGAVVNVAVAWGCAAWSPVGCETLTDVRRCEGFGIQLTRISDDKWPELHLIFANWRTAAGFPILCLDGGLWGSKTPGGQRPYTHARELPVVIEPLAQARINYEAILPLHAIWPGFAVNTLFYAGILWLLIPGPFALRRLIRRRRGLCPKCAYPMGESAVCSECGNELPKRVRPAT